MMKKFFIASILPFVFQIPVFANQPFRYTSKCYIGDIQDNCVVIETREKDGGLKSRNIFSNKMGLTIKMRWVGDKYLTWDSHNKFEYQWSYKPNPDITEDGITGTLVMPGVTLINVSWD